MNATETAATTEQRPVVQGVPPHYRGAAILRIKAAVAKTSSKTGQPMVELDLEVLKPETYESPFDGRLYALDSKDLKAWLCLWDTTKDGKLMITGLSWLNNVLLPMLGLSEINPANPIYHEEKNPTGVKFLGVSFECVIGAEEAEETRELPNGKREVIKDMQGKPIKRGWRWLPVDLQTISRRCEVETNKAF